MKNENAMVTVKLGDRSFDVSADGAVYQETRTAGVDLDEVRLQASDTFLAEARTRGLTRAQHSYWAGMHMKTDLLRNFARVERRS